MKVPNSIINLTAKALSESVDVNLMQHLAKMLIDDYNLYKRMGFRESMAIPNRDAAKHIATDMSNSGLFYHFVNILIEVHTKGYMGRKYPISYLKEIVKQIQKSGYIYDHENKIFVEDPDVQRTRNWGALLEGKEYFLSFLRLDIVGNSKLVRKYPEDIIQKTYGDLRRIVKNAIDKRNGRIWNWEGDGGLVAFYFSNKNLLATLSGIEVINEIFIYNLMACRLEEPLQVRVAIHSGLCDYTKNAEELMKNDVIKETIQIEAKHAKPNTATISGAVSLSFDESITDSLKPVMIDPRTKYYNYSVQLEN